MSEDQYFEDSEEQEEYDESFEAGEDHQFFSPSSVPGGESMTPTNPTTTTTTTTTTTGGRQRGRGGRGGGFWSNPRGRGTFMRGHAMRGQERGRGGRGGRGHERDRRSRSASDRTTTTGTTNPSSPAETDARAEQERRASGTADEETDHPPPDFLNLSDTLSQGMAQLEQELNQRMHAWGTQWARKMREAVTDPDNPNGGYRFMF